MGNVMNFLTSFTEVVINLQFYHDYPALLVLVKDILLILEFQHTFLSIVLLNLSCKLTYMSGDNSLLM